MRTFCICIFFVHLLAPIARAKGVPTIRSFLLQNETFPEKYRHLPFVAKCCPPNEIFVKDGNKDAMCTSSNDSSVYFSPRFSNSNNTGALVPGHKYKEFVAIVGTPCDRRYMLEPNEKREDKYYLLLNGSLFVPDHPPTILMPGEDYCMEIVPKLGLTVFICFSEEDSIVSPGTDARITIYACGLLISVPFLILTIVAYMITPRLRDVHGKALCHYCGCLALAFTTLAIAQLASSELSSEVCVSIAFVIQFSFVACFFWLNVMCIETWAMVQHHVNHTHRRITSKTLFFYYSIWAWGSPAFFILLSLTMDLNPTIPMTYVKPNFGVDSCWFKSDKEAMPYFYIPVSLLLLQNMILFIITAIKISRYQQELALRRLASNQHSDREDRKLFRRLTRTFIVCVVLFFLMGLNWIMELISWWIGGDPLDWSAFDLVNALQGILVFGLFVLRRPIRDFVWHRIQKLRGIHIAEPEVGSMELALLPVINGDSLPGQTVIQ